MKARKTEYRGVVFKSKAEARLALFLEQQGDLWWYEPSSLQTDDGYVPDFLVLCVNKTDHEPDEEISQSNFYVDARVVEYKPAKPTKAYISELAGRFEQIANKMHSDKTFDMMVGCVVNVSFLLLVGGMGYEDAMSLTMSWNGPYAKFSVRKWQTGWTTWDVCPDSVNRRLSKFRFDLEGAF